MITILEIKQNTEEWLKAREGKITGSNAELLLTAGVQATLKANYDRHRGNYYTDRGHRLEPEAIEVYEGIHGTKVARPGMVINDFYPNCSCSPDGIDDEYLIEVKCFSEKNHKAIKEFNYIPTKIMAQLQFNMMICELKISRLVMYNPDIEDNDEAYYEIEVKANKAIQANLARKLKNK